MPNHQKLINGAIVRRWPDDTDFFDTVEGTWYLDSMEDFYGPEPELDTPDYWA